MDLKLFWVTLELNQTGSDSVLVQAGTGSDLVLAETVSVMVLAVTGSDPVRALTVSKMHMDSVWRQALYLVRSDLGWISGKDSNDS